MLSIRTKSYNISLMVSLITCCVAASLSGCKSISNPLTRTEANFSSLPIDAVTEVAYYLESQVRQGNRTPELPNRPELIIDTPEIKQVMRSRSARAHLIQELLDSGHMVEQSDGKIAIIRSSEYKNAGTRHDRDRHALIIISENRDRVIMYDSLRNSNGFSSAERSAVEEIFFDARKASLESGQKYRIGGGEIQIR